MNCEQARLQLGAAPGVTEPELEEHLRGCVACAGFAREMRALDARIQRALALDSAVLRAARPAPVKARPQGRRWALAAGLLVAFLAALAAWSLRPHATLAAELIAHLDGERASWASNAPVPRAELEAALREAGVRFDAAAGEIVYARSCWFRGRYVPHLVVRTAAGPLTVIVLRAERVAERQPFADEGYAGVLQPLAAGGALAVLGRGRMPSGETVGQLVSAFTAQQAAGAD